MTGATISSRGTQGILCRFFGRPKEIFEVVRRSNVRSILDYNPACGSVYLLCACPPN